MGRDLYVCTAGDLATRSVASRPPDATVVATTDWLESEGFDVAHVIDPWQRESPGLETTITISAS